MDYAMSSDSAQSSSRSTPTAWWRVPHMWLVVGGPLLVVVAGIATVILAVRNPDPVLDKAVYERDLAPPRIWKARSGKRPSSACSPPIRRATTPRRRWCLRASDGSCAQTWAHTV